MKHLNIHDHKKSFAPLMNSRHVQAAVMILQPGDSSSDEVVDEHPAAEQWLYVVSGSGTAQLKTARVKLKEGDLLLIPKRTPHRVSNNGRKPLRTLNFYSPPAYTTSGDVKPAAKK